MGAKRDSLLRIDEYFDTYRRNSLYDQYLRKYTFGIFMPYLNRSQQVLELGCSDGYMSQLISQHVGYLDVVDGSARFLDMVKSLKLTNVNYTLSAFEDFSPNKKYDAIFATFVLTHISDTTAFLTMIKNCLRPDGFLFVAVPNVRSISRQLALHMNLFDDLYTLTQNDRDHGHCRAYDMARLAAEFASNGLNVVDRGGIVLKPLADFQMDKLLGEKILGDAQMEGFRELGREYPDISAAIYCIGKL